VNDVEREISIPLTDSKGDVHVGETEKGQEEGCAGVEKLSLKTTSDGSPHDLDDLHVILSAQGSSTNQQLAGRDYTRA
jgi:hypothetical protein